MGFKLPKEARSYFKLIDDRSNNKFKILFDRYYLCLMAGFSCKTLGKQEEIENADFLDSYPELYVDKAELIAGLLINSEMERQGIDSTEQKSVENLILQVIDNNSSTKLSNKGLDLLNCYAASGMNFIRDNIPKTSELETFLVYYQQLLNPKITK